MTLIPDVSTSQSTDNSPTTTGVRDKAAPGQFTELTVEGANGPVSIRLGRGIKVEDYGIDVLRANNIGVVSQILQKEGGQIHFGGKGELRVEGQRGTLLEATLSPEDLKEVLKTVGWNAAAQYQKCFNGRTGNTDIIVFDKSLVDKGFTEESGRVGYTVLNKAGKEKFAELTAKILVTGGSLSVEPETGRIYVKNDKGKNVFQVASNINEDTEEIMGSIVDLVNKSTSRSTPAPKKDNEASAPTASKEGGVITEIVVHPSTPDGAKEDLKNHRAKIMALAPGDKIPSADAQAQSPSFFQSETGRTWFRNADGRVFYNSQGNKDHTWGCISDSNLYLAKDNKVGNIKLTDSGINDIACFVGNGQVYDYTTEQAIKPNANGTLNVPGIKDATSDAVVVLNAKNEPHRAIVTPKFIGYFADTDGSLLMAETFDDDLKRNLQAIRDGKFDTEIEDIRIDKTGNRISIHRRDTLIGEFVLRSGDKDPIWTPTP